MIGLQRLMNWELLEAGCCLDFNKRLVIMQNIF